MSTPSAILVSPHLDDAAFSAASRAMTSGTQVVTVYAGDPPPHIGLTDYDRFTRAESSAARHAERLAEDEAGMALLGCDVVRLDELDQQYRGGPPDHDRLVERLRGYCDGVGEIWAPAALGSAVDHASVRDAAIAAATHDADVYLYADIPRAVTFGWPTWVTGRPEPQYVDVEWWLERELEACGLDPSRLTRHAVALTDAQRDRKQRAVACYRTQLPALCLSTDGPNRWDAFLDFEVAWRYRR
ncbi:PIG-L family deacetylase [Hamadaea sp. NPDC051192]|uniref:PIG-L family deacetylase n=1 Tax=Hamadaea sp. NPDC051192 TaxID=3154940 RepID=UPI003432C2E3